MKKRVLIFIVCYNAEHFIEKVLDRIPEAIWQNKEFDTEVLVIDDQSSDQTFDKAYTYAASSGHSNIKVLYNPRNQGYGGNQKIGYHYAILNGFDAVALLHGDGQYAPEFLPQMIQPIMDDQADAVFGSRMIRKRDALKGKMPIYKWIGNQILTAAQNMLLKANLSEFHTGYRAYSVPALASIPFMHNSNYFDFDTDIIIQLLDTKKRIKEIAVPTFYGNEISRVNGLRYAGLIMQTSIRSRLMRWNIFYHPKFDYETSNEYYSSKFGFYSSHQFAIRRVKPFSTVLDVGCGPGFVSRELSKKNVKTISIDRFILPTAKQYSYRSIQADVETYDFETGPGKIDTILLLDIIEHMKSPETLLRTLRERYAPDAPEVIITTGNIASLPVRLGLMLGQFNYGKRGILDLDHARLFTFSTLRSLLSSQGYEIIEERGIPVPFPLALGNNRIAQLLLRMNYFLICISKGIFSYQIAVVARPQPTLHHLLNDAQEEGKLRARAVNGVYTSE